ncbi:MAG: NTP transferase domain-containing protein [Desulfosporosinus sp.]|nr:NTP transferase domain-containing protein [Desulfosporosinus sp.]
MEILEKLGVKSGLILAAGLGSRMTFSVSKPMTKVLGKPLIIYAIDAMLHCEIEKIFIVYSNVSEDILLLKDSYKRNVVFIKQDNVKGSLSSFLCSKDFISCPFILMDADIIIDCLQMQRMLEKFNYGGENMIITAVENPSFEDKKVLLINNNQLIGFCKSGYQEIIEGDQIVQGGMVYLWFRSPFDMLEEFMQNGCNKLSVFLEEYVKRFKVGVMYIEDLWDVDTPEDILISEDILLRKSIYYG